MSVKARTLAALCAAAVCLVGLLAQAPFSFASGVASQRGTVIESTHPAVSVAAASAALRQADQPTPPGSQRSRLPNPGKVLPSGWARSADKAVTLQGDAAGLHVLVADEKSGYTWRTVATLGDAAVETSQWIGQGCVTGSGSYMVVVYAPQQVTNMAGEMGVLGRAAVVNLDTGAVRQLGGGFSVAYFDPGCGVGPDAVLTRGGWGGDSPALPAATQLEMVNAATGAITENVTVPGQATSAVPYRGAIAAAYRQGIEQIRPRGKLTLIARSSTIPFRLVPDAAGGLGYQSVQGSRVRLYHLARGHVDQVGSAPKGTMELEGRSGRVWLTGTRASSVRNLPAAWRALDIPAGSAVSSTGELAVTGTTSGARAGLARRDPLAPLPVDIAAKVLSGSQPQVSFSVPPAAGPRPAPQAGRLHSAEGGRGTMTPADSSGDDTTTISPDRTCSIPVDDPSIQAYQPTFQQVEWAVDEAVHGNLTGTRQAGLYGSSLPAYSPQGNSGLFPLESLDGGGTVPAQVLLGILTQESNLEQASRHVIQGQTSNPLTSFNWFGNWQTDSSGNTFDSGLINWAASDCGYGIGQVTSGMCLALYQNSDPECEYNPPMSGTDQLAVAVDYQANIAASLRILSDDWNQLYGDGITMNASESTPSQYIENWYLALWAYNSGLEPGSSKLGNTTGCTPGPSCTDGNGDWGLGYADNPADPEYPPDRPPFPESSTYLTPTGAEYSPSWDMSHPQYWTYQEKVISWAFDSVTLYDYNKGADVQAFAYASGNPVYPPVSEFCSSADNCNSGVLNTTQPTSAGDACQLTGNYLDHCWWHWPITFTTCSKSCGSEVLTYAAGAPDPGPPTIAPAFQEDCTLGGLPSTAVIVGQDEAALGCPGQTWTNAGPMTWNFGAASDGTNPSKIYFDQIGAGFGGHFWFSYTIPNDQSLVIPDNPDSTAPANNYAQLEITGTWPAPSTVSGWTNVLVHMPSYGAWSPDAMYQIDPGGGQAVQYRAVNQARQANAWISLGVFDLGSGANVSLSNVTYDATGEDIAWNGAAFVPTTAPTTNYVAMGDSYSSGQGLPLFDPDSDYNYDGMTDACHRSGTSGQQEAYSQLVTLPGQSQPIARQVQADLAGPATYNFIACSGIFTTAITQQSAGNHTMTNVPWDQVYPGANEALQADSGWLNSSTTLVTLTVGGDDARFASVLKACIATTSDCADSNYYMTYTQNGQVDPEPLYEYEPQVISTLFYHLQETYQAIASAAPNAEIIVLGYPRLFPNDTNSGTCLVGYGISLGGDVTSMLNGFGDQLNQEIGQAVASEAMQGVNIHFIDPNNPGPGDTTGGFVGHEICSTAPYLNGLTAPSSSGSGSSTPGVGSFHPNANGQAEYAKLVDECLAGTIAC